MGWEEGFLVLLCVVFIFGVVKFLKNKNKPKEVTQPKKTRPKDITRPVDAWDQGYHDMVWAVHQMMFKNSTNYEFRFRVQHQWDDPIKEMAELIIEANILKRYRDFDIKKGRTSRRYLASNDSNEFAQYVLGGRTAIDQFDDVILNILEEKELAKARQEGLETFDNQYNSVRKSLGIIRDKDYRVLTEHDEFDKKMRGIDDGKKNKT